MHTSDWLQLLAYVIALGSITQPLGRHLCQVLDSDGTTWLDRWLRPVEQTTYRLLGIDARRDHDWRQYTAAMLLLSAVSCLCTYGVLRCQHRLPLNPEGLGAVPAHLAFNTAISFVTNTDWQSYAGESTLSTFSQMVALVPQQFISAAVGIGVAAALVRGLARGGAGLLGNFWVDLVRVTYYVLLPLSVGFALFLVSQGVVQNFKPYTRAALLEPQMIPGEGEGGGAPRIVRDQVIVQGPVASQVAIKILGTNGGGYANANAAHPFENPTALSNALQMLAIFSIGSGLTHYFGRMVRNPAHGWTLWAVMLLLFVAGSVTCTMAERRGNPIHEQLGVTSGDGNLEGKEVRFGILHSALFATITTDATCGAVNAMHDSFTPLGGLVPLFNIQLGGIVFGGVGVGLCGMIVFVLLAVFIAGLMIGRTPEYLGRRLGCYEVKMAVLCLLVPCGVILAFTAAASVGDWGTRGLGHRGPHGLSEMLYAFSSTTGNNGSAFAGLSTNDPAYNAVLGVAMLLGRFFVIIPTMAIAGAFASGRTVAAHAGSFPVSGGTFGILLIATILMVGALNFLPVLALGPIVEHFLMHDGRLF